MRASRLFPQSPIISVNGAAREVPAFALYSFHAGRMAKWAGEQTRKFGPGFSTHSREPGVDYHWPETNGGGGSAWGARKMASFMGFDLVVLCGCPLDPGPYTGNHNLGGFMHKGDVVKNLRDGIMNEPEWHPGCISMSGWTRKVLDCLQ